MGLPAFMFCIVPVAPVRHFRVLLRRLHVPGGCIVQVGGPGGGAAGQRTPDVRRAGEARRRCFGEGRVEEGAGGAAEGNRARGQLDNRANRQPKWNLRLFLELSNFGILNLEVSDLWIIDFDMFLRVCSIIE